MKKSVSPVVVAVIILVVLAVVGYFGYKTVSPPPATVKGIGPNGQPMTDADIENLKNKMRPGGSGANTK